MNCAFLCRCFLMLMLLVLPFGCEDGGNEEMTSDEESEMDEQHASDAYQQYNQAGQEGPGGGHGGAGGGHAGGGSAPPQ